MSNNIFNSMNTGVNKLMAPISGLNKTAIDNLAKVAELQFSTAKYLADVGVNQLKAVADVDNLESARSFATKSIELAGQINKKLLEDSQKYFSLGAEFKSGVKNIFTPSAAPTAEQSQETAEEQKAKKAAAAK